MITNRDDLSTKLIHLTKGSWNDASDSFLKILAEKALLGGAGGIRDNLKCVCFSEAPIAKLSYILAHRSQIGFRYAPFGVMVDKIWLFKLGGRPVIYQPNSEYELLHQEQKFRHKEYDPILKVDFTWEREWRIQTERLVLEPEFTTVVVPNREWEERLLNHSYSRIQRWSMLSTPGIPFSIIKNEWHFIVLEDLGVVIPEEIKT